MKFTSLRHHVILPSWGLFFNILIIFFMFKVMLTLMGDASTIPWRVLSIDFLVQDKETGGDLLKDTCKFVWLLVLSLSPRVFSLGTPVALVFSSPQKSAFLNSCFVWFRILWTKRHFIVIIKIIMAIIIIIIINNDSNNSMSLEKFKSARNSNPLWFLIAYRLIISLNTIELTLL